MHNAIMTHVVTIYIFLIIMVFNLYNVVTIKSFITLSKRLKFMTPLYHLSNAIIMYTGAIIWAYSDSFSFKVALMVPTSIFLLVIEIKRYKKMRIIKSNDITLQTDFKIYAKKIYIIELASLIGIFIISKVL